MVQKYQNEIAPTFYYGISTKTNEKDIKIPKLQPPDWKSSYWMSLYFNSKYEVCLYQDPSWLQTAAQPRKLIRIRYEDLGEHSIKMETVFAPR